MKYCPNCIAQLPDNALTCEYCGAKQEAQPNETSSRSQFVDMSDYRSDNYYSTPDIEYHPISSAKPKKVINIGGPLIALVVLLAIAAGIIGFLFFTKGSSTPEKAATSVLEATFTDKDAKDVYKYSISRSMQKYYDKELDASKKKVIDGYKTICSLLKIEPLNSVSYSFKALKSKKLSASEADEYMKDDSISSVSKKAYLVPVEITVSLEGRSEKRTVEMIAYKSNFRWFAIPSANAVLY